MHPALAKGKEWVGQWAGTTIVCIASGPSLTSEDAETVRQSGLTTIVTNTTFRMCPWAHVLLAHDAKWWKEYRGEVDEVFTGKRLTCSPSVGPGVLSLRLVLTFKAFQNSGCAAISLAVLGKAERVVLLGYDAKPANDGRIHWHGDHPETLSNARTMDKWPRKFEQVAAYARQHKVPVLNASRDTALTCFPRVELDEAIRTNQVENPVQQLECLT